MQCPACEYPVKKSAHFCSRCGHAIPILVGASYPYGIRFPAPMKPSNYYQTVVNCAQLAPKYRERTIGKTLYHAALFDRLTFDRFLPLLTKVYKLYSGRREVIEHTTDGRRFIYDFVPWACFYHHVIHQRPADSVYVSHPGFKCHSYFGCLLAQDRQQHFEHSDGREIFLHGYHGRFENISDKDVVVFNDRWSSSAYEKLKRAHFVLDKAAIKGQILRLVKSRQGHHCPGFSYRHLEEQVRKLPPTIELGKTPGWGPYVSAIGQIPGVYYECYRDRTIEASSREILLLK